MLKIIYFHCYLLLSVSPLSAISIHGLINTVIETNISAEYCLECQELRRLWMSKLHHGDTGYWTQQGPSVLQAWRAEEMFGINFSILNICT